MSYENTLTNNPTEETSDSDGNRNTISIESLWDSILVEMMEMEPSSIKKISVPFGRVKKIIKTEEVALHEMKRIAEEQEEIVDVESRKCVFMISEETPYVMAKAAEMFIRDITTRAWIHADTNRRKTIQKSDIIHAASDSDTYDFLIDVIPRLLQPTTDGNDNSSTTTTSTTAAATAADTPSMYAIPLPYNQMVQQQPQPPTATTTDMIQVEISQQQEPISQQESIIMIEDEKQQPLQMTDDLEPYSVEPLHHNVQQQQQQLLLQQELAFPADLIFSPVAEGQEPSQNHHLDETSQILPVVMDDLQQQQHQDSSHCYNSSSTQQEQWTLE